MAGYQTAHSTAPAYRAAEITQHDTNAIECTRAIYVGAAGNLKVTMLSGADVTFYGVAAGTFLPIQATRVFSTGSTAFAAGSLLALY